MIKLVDLLKENGDQTAPYMYSPIGFGCHVCKYLNYNKDEGKYTCANTNYEKHMGTHFIIDPETREPVEKENLNKYCSNWFMPKGE